jgi:ankyrin repeat protein
LIFIFLADIVKRSSFTEFEQWESSVYSLYTCSFLVKHKVDIHEGNDYALMQASEHGHKDSVALLLEHKANIHAKNGYALFEQVQMVTKTLCICFLNTRQISMRMLFD